MAIRISDVGKKIPVALSIAVSETLLHFFEKKMVRQLTYSLNGVSKPTTSVTAAPPKPSSAG